MDYDDVGEILGKFSTNEAVALAVGVDKGKVRVDFGRTVSYLNMQPDQADALAVALESYAKDARR